MGKEERLSWEGGVRERREMVWLERITPNQLDGKSGAGGRRETGREGERWWRWGRIAFSGN